MIRHMITVLVLLSVLAGTSAHATPLAPPPGLVDWWRAEGNGADAVGGLTATLTSGMAFTTGKVGQAFSFSGTPGDFVSVADSPTLNFGTNEFSLAVWIKTSATGTWKRIVTKRPASASTWYSLALNSGKVTLEVAGSVSVTSTASVANGQWHHVAVTRDPVGTPPRYYHLYIDGVQANTLNDSGLDLSNNAPLEIGKWSTEAYNGTIFAGAMDEFRVYNRALTPSEVQYIYNAATPVVSAPTVSNLGANQAPLSITATGDGSITGYFTLLAGSGTPCGTAAQVKSGSNSAGTAAFRHGSLPLTTGVAGSYTIRNLTGSTAYTACVMADNGSNSAVQSLNLATTAVTSITRPLWSAVGSAGFSADTADYTSLAFAPDGTPYVAYQDGGDNFKATVMKFNGSGWGSVGSARFSASSAIYTSLAFAPDGTPYVAYQDVYNGQKATVMKFNGSEWISVGSAGFSAAQAYTSLAFAPDGTPYVAYLDGGDNYKATVMKFNGSEWISVGSAGFSADMASYTSLAFAPDGTPYVAYADYGTGNKTTVMKFNGSGWSSVGSAGFSAGPVTYTSLAFAPDGTPYVAYQDVYNGQKATVMKFNGSEWISVGSAGFSAAQAYTSLAFAPDGTPYVAYMDYGTGKATVMKFNGSGWITVGSAGFSAGFAVFTSLAFAPDGTPYLAYKDGGNSSMATVMRLSSSYSVTYDGNGSDGGSVPVDGNSPYASGSSVTVLANSGILTRTGYTFAGWNSKADGSGTAYSAGATFIISTDTILYAQWNRSSRTLTVNVSGSGTGTVSSAPAGIMCDKTGSSTATCSNTFTEDVTLTATRTKYSVFQEWSSCIGTGACLVTMDSDKGVTATFNMLRIGTEYLTLQAVYDAAPDGSVIELLQTTGTNSAGTLSPGRGVTVRLSGGYDPGYGATTGRTTITKPVKIGKGKVIAERIVIK